MLQQSIAGHKPLVDKLVKTGEALSRLCGDEDAAKVQDIVDQDCERYNALRAELRQRQQQLERVSVRETVIYIRLFVEIIVVLSIILYPWLKSRIASLFL